MNPLLFADWGRLNRLFTRVMWAVAVLLVCVVCIALAAPTPSSHAAPASHATPPSQSTSRARSIAAQPAVPAAAPVSGDSGVR